MVSMSMFFAQTLFKASGNSSVLREMYALTLLLLDELAGRVSSSILVRWDPSNWLSILLANLDHEVCCRAGIRIDVK
jgi:hypothetical protein